MCKRDMEMYERYQKYIELPDHVSPVKTIGKYQATIETLESVKELLT